MESGKDFNGGSAVVTLKSTDCNNGFISGVAGWESQNWLSLF